jgi:hypothetical protein
MAAPDIVKGSYVDILMGDGEDPEVFTQICGITTRNITHQVNTNDQFVPDCADPEDVPHRRLNPTGEQWDLSGEGLLNLANWQSVDGAVGVTGNFRFVVTRPTGSTTGIGYWEGPAMITNLQIGGTQGDGGFASISITLASDGVWTLNDGAQP